MSQNKQLIQKMTLEEKASLMSGKDFWNSRGVDRLNIPEIAMADGPHGLRKQADAGDHLGLNEGVKATCFPTSATMANSWDLELCEEVGRALGKEAAFNDVNILLGPGLNVKRNPLCGRNFEYFSEDPYLSGKLAAAYIKGIQTYGASACPKHFAANSQEHLRMTNDSIVDERTLHEIYLTGFEIAVKEGKPKAIMSAYNKVNGTYANEHPYLLKDVLVDQWGFDGIVISDWGGANDPVEGVRNGSHLEMPTPGYDSIERIVNAVQNGQMDEKVLNERVEKYLDTIDRCRLDKKVQVDLEEHHKLARKAAEGSAVLLKNQDVLPLKSNQKVAIIGDFAREARYQGAGSSMVNPYRLDSVMDVINEFPIDVVGFAQGFTRGSKNDDRMIAEAVKLAEESEVALLFVGLDEVAETEGNDRTTIAIGKQQMKLIDHVSAAAKKTVVVISGGSVIEMPWVEKCDGILHGYLAGQAGARALLKVLTGKVNPSGKLTETHVVEYDDCPNAIYYPGQELTSEYREGIYVGYRYYDKANVNVLYPFGYGLSYTTFEYSNLEINESGVRFTIKNTGSKAGSEIAQLYVGKDQQDVHRPEKELKGFSKVHLEPGESKDVEIFFDEYTFRYYDVSSHGFQIQDGEYCIKVGSSSRDICLEDMLRVKGIEVNADDYKGQEKYFAGEVSNLSSDEFEILYGKKLPPSKSDRNQPLHINDSLSRMVDAKSLFARLSIKILLMLKDRSFKKGKPDLNLFFLSNMPFRAIAKMSDGAVSLEMTEHIVEIVNGRFFRGMSKLAGEFFSYRKRGK